MGSDICLISHMIPTTLTSLWVFNRKTKKRMNAFIEQMLRLKSYLIIRRRRWHFRCVSSFGGKNRDQKKAKRKDKYVNSVLHLKAKNVSSNIYTFFWIPRWEIIDKKINKKCFFTYSVHVNYKTSVMYPFWNSPAWFYFFYYISIYVP